MGNKLTCKVDTDKVEQFMLAIAPLSKIRQVTVLSFVCRLEPTIVLHPAVKSWCKDKTVRSIMRYIAT